MSKMKYEAIKWINELLNVETSLMDSRSTIMWNDTSSAVDEARMYGELIFILWPTTEGSSQFWE